MQFFVFPLFSFWSLMQILSGVILSKSSGTIQFNEGVAMLTQDILIGGDGFIEMDTTFTITLTQVQYLGAGGIYI